MRALITVLRLGHRVARDKRISTHCGLVARAFGANQVIYSGERDDTLVQSVNSLAANWGGNFVASYQGEWKKAINEAKRAGQLVVHLTMYGQPFEKKIGAIRKRAFGKRGKGLLIVIGAEKVPWAVYELADYNLGVTSQPHSEVGALAVFLYELTRNRPAKFGGALLKIIPSPKGKKVNKQSDKIKI